MKMKQVMPYMSMQGLGLAFAVSQPYLRKIVQGIKREISEGRYSDYVIAGRRISLYAVIDYMTYMDYLNDASLRKRVPSFDPIAIARLCGQEGLELC